MDKNEAGKSGGNFIGYDYKTVTVENDKISLYLNSYQNFGWMPDENTARRGSVLKLKRDRKIINKTELTRLERNFESCMVEIEALEKGKTSTATMFSIIIGLIGTAFLTGSVFAVTNTPPLIPLTVILGFFGIIGWILPPLLYKTFVKRSTEKLSPLIEAKYDEVYEVCENGNKLLNN